MKTLREPEVALVLAIFAVILVMCWPSGPDVVNRAIDSQLNPIDRALGLPTATPATAMVVETGPMRIWTDLVESEVTAAPAGAVLVDITPGCWREISSANDTRLWGWGWREDGSQFFNTTYQKFGSVIEETLTLEEILAISSDWESWEQRCSGDPTSTPAPTATPTSIPSPTPIPPIQVSPTPTPTVTLVPPSPAPQMGPPAALVQQIQDDTAFVLEAAEKMRRYVGASKADKDIVTAAEPALRFILDAKANGLLAALPEKSGVWGENSVASWSKWSASLRSQAEEELGLTKTAFGWWFKRNFAGVELGAEIILPKGAKTFGATYKGVREGGLCTFGAGILNDHEFNPSETIQIDPGRRFDVQLLECDEEKAIVVMIGAESAAGRLFDQGILEKVLVGPARGHPSVQDIYIERDTVFRTGAPVLLKRGDNLVEEDGRVVTFAEAIGNTIRFTVYKTGKAEETWEVPDGSVIRIIIRREVGEGLYSQQYRAVRLSDEIDLVYLKPLDPGWYDGGTVNRVP